MLVGSVYASLLRAIELWCDVLGFLPAGKVLKNLFELHGLIPLIPPEFHTNMCVSAVNWTTPSYLSHILQPYCPICRSLRSSADLRTLNVPKSNCKIVCLLKAYNNNNNNNNEL